jgi:hypothetical protein
MMDNTDVLIRGYSPTPPKSEAYFGTPAPSLFFGIEFEQDRTSVEERIGYRLTLSNILRAEEICFAPESDDHAYIVVAYRTDAHGNWAQVLYPFWLELPYGYVEPEDAVGVHLEDARPMLAAPEPETPLFIYRLEGVISEEAPREAPPRVVSDFEQFICSRLPSTSLTPITAIPRGRPIDMERAVRASIAQLFPAEAFEYPPHIEHIIDQYDQYTGGHRCKVTLGGIQRAGFPYLEGGYRMSLDLDRDLITQVTDFYRVMGYRATLIEIANVPRWGYLGYFILEGEEDTVFSDLRLYQKELAFLGALYSPKLSWDSRESIPVPGELNPLEAEYEAAVRTSKRMLIVALLKALGSILRLIALR